MQSRTKSLGYPEQQAITDFVGSQYTEMRRWDKEGDTESVKDFYGGYEKLPKFDGTIYRGLHDLEPDDLERLTASDHLTLDAMSSFTRSEDIGLAFSGGEGHGDVLLKMKSKTGRNAEHVSTSPNEREVIAGRGTRYKIKKVYYADYEKYGKRLVIEGEEV